MGDAVVDDMPFASVQSAVAGRDTDPKLDAHGRCVAMFFYTCPGFCLDLSEEDFHFLDCKGIVYPHRNFVRTYPKTMDLD